MIWAWVLLAAYLLMQVVSVGFLYFRQRREERLKNIAESWQGQSWPGISVVTSLKGETPQLEAGLRCILQQDYPGPMEFVIVVQDSGDFVLHQAKELVSQINSKISVTWVTDFPLRGFNPRSAKMAEGFSHAKHPWLYWHAIDSIIPNSFLKDSMALTEGRSDQYVTTFPVNISPKNFGAAIETMALNLEVTKFFAFSFLDKKSCVAYGGALLAHRSLLETSEALQGTLNRLTDDMVLAQAFKKAGARCLMGPSLAYVPQEFLSFKEFFKRQVRWMMIARHYMKPLFFVSPLFWLGQFFLLFAAIFWNPEFLILTALFFGIRILQTYSFEVLLKTPVSDHRHVWVIPFYDVLLPICWTLAIITRRLNWAGDIMVVGSNGILKKPTG